MKKEEVKEIEELLEKIEDIDGDYFDRVNWDGSVNFNHEEEEILLIKEVLIKLLSKLLKEEE